MANKTTDRWQLLAVERSKREREALAIYRPSPQQAAFHRAAAPERIIRGGKRAGKSISAAMEFASMVTGTPITLEDGTQVVPRHQVSTPDAPRQYWIIGWDTSHAATIHRLLFQRGMGGTLRTIRDKATGEWRIWNRADPDDQARFKESRLAEPIIPPRLIKEETWAWESKKDYKFQSVELTNGAIIYYWPSSAKSPKQGEAVSGIWIDEDIQVAGHLKEWQDRLTDMEGWFMWSVWPHIANDGLRSLIDRADASADEGEENPQIEAFQLVMSQNAFLTEKGKSESLGRMQSEDEIARRDRGELMMDQFIMYDFYPSIHLLEKPKAHDVIRDDTPDPRAWLRRLLMTEGRMPRTFTRYLVIDPSHTRTAVQSWAVPPQCPNDAVILGNVAICEWELVVKKYSAHMLASALEPLMAGFYYEAFIMDKRAGRQTSIGRSETTFEAYSEAFASKKLVSRTTGSGFVPGVDIPSARHRAVREGLAVSQQGIPTFLFIADKCQQTIKEFGRYRKKIVNAGGEELILDEPANPRLFDAMAALEYFAAYIMPQFLIDGAYVEPSVYGGSPSPAFRKAQEMMRRHSESNPEYVHMGPGAAA